MSDTGSRNPIESEPSAGHAKPSSSAGPTSSSVSGPLFPGGPPDIPDHELLRCIGRGALLSVSDDRRVRIWSVATGEQLVAPWSMITNFEPPVSARTALESLPPGALGGVCSSFAPPLFAVPPADPNSPLRSLGLIRFHFHPYKQPQFHGIGRFLWGANGVPEPPGQETATAAPSHLDCVSSLRLSPGPARR